MSSVIQKSMTLLNAIKPEKDKEEWSATEISKKLGIPVQTVHRLLCSLSQAGFVSKSLETKKFRLSFNIIQMGFALRNSLSVYHSSLPIMANLAEETKQRTFLSVVEDLDGVIVNWLGPKTLMTVDPQVLRNPLHRGAANKVLLAHLRPSLKEKTIHSLMKVDKHLLKDQLETELRMIKKQGCSITVGEIRDGFAEIAAPIFSWEEKVVASLSTTIPVSMAKKHFVEELVISVIKAAEDISEELGWYN